MASAIRLCASKSSNLPRIILKPAFVSSLEMQFIKSCNLNHVSHSFKRNTNTVAAFLTDIHVNSKNDPKSLNVISRKYSQKFLTWPTPKLPFEFVRPEKKDALLETGDPKTYIGKIDPTKPKMFFEMSEELKTADENVKRMFSLAMATNKEKKEYKKAELIRSIQQHKFDFTSDEVKIALLTFKVRSLQWVIFKSPYDRPHRIRLNEAIHKRNKRLKLLRRANLEKFQWLVDVLQIDYKPPLLGHINRPVTRKGELRRLTQEFCDSIRNKRLNAFHETLKAQQADFLKEKAETLKFIEEEEKKIAITDGKK